MNVAVAGIEKGTKTRQLEHVSVQSKKRRKTTPKKVKSKTIEKAAFLVVAIFLERLSFLVKTFNKVTNKLPGVLTIALSLVALEYAHEVLKGLVGPVDYKVITGTLIILFVLGCKSEYNSYKKKLKMEKELKKRRFEDKHSK